LPIKHFSRLFIPVCGFFIWISLAGCKKVAPLPLTNAVPADFSQVFDAFWNGMNTNYVYWDIDTTDWDDMYTRYKPVFAQLNLQDNNDLQRSVGYFRQMTDGLIDNHLTINFIPNSIINSSVVPAMDRKTKDSNFHRPFPYLSIDSLYFDKGYRYGAYFTSANQRVDAACATLSNKILYFTCSQFALQEAYQSTNSNGVKTVLQYLFDQLQNLPPNIKGLIIDVRNNHGGDLVDLNFLVGRLIDKPLHFGYTKYKSGNGRLAYTPWVDATVIPQTGAKAIQVPIIVMADNYSISMAETVAMAIKILPNSTFVGETTWGATGSITDNVVYDDGQFTVPDFLSVYTSSAAFRYINGKIYEGKGFPPDIPIPFNLSALNSGKDVQLEAAINLIK
jgi:carboxyl-terminal processing protease